MTRITVAALRVLLVLLFLGAFSGQAWFVPQLAMTAAREWPDLAHLAAPYTVWWIVIIACVQAALVALWVLLSKVRRGRIFSSSAFGWVNGIIAAGILATLLVLTFEFHLLGVEDLGPPALGILLTDIVIAGAAFTLVMVVMRSLLLSATSLQTELDEVV